MVIYSFEFKKKVVLELYLSSYISYILFPYSGNIVVSCLKNNI